MSNFDSYDEYMDYLEEGRNFAIGNAVLTVVVLVPAAVFWCMSFFKARRRQDKARSWLFWLKTGLPIFMLFCIFEIAFSAASAALFQLQIDESAYDYNGDVLYAVQEIALQAAGISIFWDRITDVVLFLLLISLGGGIVLLRNGQPDKLSRIYRFASWAFATIVVILSIAYLGLRISWGIAAVYPGAVSTSFEDAKNQYEAHIQIHFAVAILLWAVSLSTFIRSSMLMIEGRKDTPTVTPSRYLTVCAFLFLIKTTFNVAFQLAYHDIAEPLEFKEYDSYAEILRVIFSTWPAFIIFTIMYFLAGKKDNGLWSTAGANTQAPTAYQHDTHSSVTPQPAQTWNNGYQQQPEQQYQQQPEQQYQQPYQPEQQYHEPSMQQHHEPPMQQHQNQYETQQSYASPPIPQPYK